MSIRYFGLPARRPVALALTPEETARALLSDDDLARAALAFDVRHIVTFVTENRTEQIEALNTLINAVEGDRLLGSDFWDAGSDCGCAIGTICHAIGIDARQNMPFDHPHVVSWRHPWEEGDDPHPMTWFDALRKTRAVHLLDADVEGGEDDLIALFVEQLLYTQTTSGRVTRALDEQSGDGVGSNWEVRPGQATWEVHADRARTLLAEVAHTLLDEVLATPDAPLTPPAALIDAQNA